MNDQQVFPWQEAARFPGIFGIRRSLLDQSQMGMVSQN
jgi:hypothetical protein